MKYLFATILGAAICLSCSDDIELPSTVDDPVEAPAVGAQDEYRQKIRTVPYPRSCNEILINPAPLIVPESMTSGRDIEIELSRDSEFSDESTLRSGRLQWCMFNPHAELEAGIWFWRFRTIADDGTTGNWSEVYDFQVKDQTPVFVTPGFDTFLDNAPRIFPRLYCFTTPFVEDVRANIESHVEYRQLCNRADKALLRDYSATADMYSQAQTLAEEISWLYQAYYLTQRREYAEKMLSFIDCFKNNPPSQTQLYSDNFTTSSLTYALAACYDLLYAQVDVDKKSFIEQWLADVLVKFFNTSRKVEENHIFDNHFWQQNMRRMLQAALTIYDSPEQGERVLPLLEYLYELWTARAPAGGFNRDGLWHNGVGYFNANVMTLCYMPVLFSYITGFDFIQHPWYLNAGRALSYTTPPAASNIGFGDASETRQTPNHQMAAFADFLAYYTDDSYAAWYAAQCGNLVNNDWEMRLRRICRAKKSQSNDMLVAPAMLSWYKDCGEVAMHSSLFDKDKDVAVGFRSSTFGSGSHTTASQNAFNLSFRGKDVFRSSGYYQNFSDAHNLMSYRHTRAHNTVLINGIGQPYSTKGYGRILRAACGDNIAYALGDASNAYCGISDDPMWIEAFKKAGIEQSVENGFGKTSLSRYYRHIAMLSDGTVVIYDELEALESSRWDWLLHSKQPFEITEAAGNSRILETVNEAEGIKSRVILLCGDVMSVSQTSQWTVPPAITGDAYPEQWHLKATVDGAMTTRYLAIIQSTSLDEEYQAVNIGESGVEVDNWRISATLDSNPPSLSISNAKIGAGLFYGSDHINFNDSFYPRHYRGSSILIDDHEGHPVNEELIDISPVSTRMN